MYKVGFVEGHLFDDERNDWSGTGPRPIGWTAWYPAAPGARESTHLLGPPDRPLFIVGQTAEGAPMEPSVGTWPVVLISHGTGGSAAGMGWLGCRLAARGYVGIAVNHHGNTAGEPYLPEGFLCWWERARDLTLALDRLSRDGPLAGRLDESRAFAAGFSLGGYTALALIGAVTDMRLFEAWTKQQPGPLGPREFPDIADHIHRLLTSNPEFRRSRQRQGESFNDDRVKAVFACAPAPPVRAFTEASLKGIKVPVGMIVGGGDAEAPHRDCAVWLHRRLPDSRLTVLGDEVGHYVFLCEATEAGRALETDICADAPGVDRRAIHDQAADLALNLFREATG